MKLTKIESYEIQAFAFRVMTGYMAPGKDVSPLACEAPYEERCAAWDEWRNKHAHCILAMLHGFEALIDRDDEPTRALLDRLDAAEREATLRAALVAAMEIVQKERTRIAYNSEGAPPGVAEGYANLLSGIDAIIAQADAALGSEG